MGTWGLARDGSAAHRDEPPESGKLLLLSAVLPPERIGVEIEVKK